MSETASPDMNVIKRIIGVFTSPRLTFEAVRERPGWVVPLIILVLIGLAMLALMGPVIMKEQMGRQVEMMQDRGMSQNQIDQAMERGAKIGNIMMYVFGVIGPVVAFLISAAVWLFVCNVLLGGAAKYAQMLGVVVYQAFIATLGGLIKLPIILSRETLNVHFSLATFMSESGKETFIYKLLSKVELFNVWGIIVLCIGIAVIGRHDIKKVWPPVVGIFVLWYLATSAFGGMFGM